MKVYRYLFFVLYKRWYRKDRDVGLATFSSIASIVIFTGVNLGAIFLNISLWFDTGMPGSGASRNELLIGVILVVIVFHLIHHFLLVHGGRREVIFNEFKDVSKKELLPLKLYIALYVLVSLILSIGLPWLHNELYDHYATMQNNW